MSLRLLVDDEKANHAPSGGNTRPYDPSAKIERLRDLDKLSAIEDRELAGYLETLFHANTARPLKPTRGQLVLPLEVKRIG